MTVIPEDDGSYSAYCDRHPLWKAVDSSEAVVRSLLAAHERLWQCRDPRTVKKVVEKMRANPNVTVIP